MNANLFHNIANVAQAAIGLITAVLMGIGCTTTPTGVDCSATNPKYAIYAGAAVSAIAILKIIVNIATVGVSGLTKPSEPKQ